MIKAPEKGIRELLAELRDRDREMVISIGGTTKVFIPDDLRTNLIQRMIEHLGVATDGTPVDIREGRCVLYEVDVLCS